jgi:hypothetical protein
MNQTNVKIKKHKGMTKTKVLSLLIFLIFTNFTHPFTKDIKKAVKLLEKEKTSILKIKNTSNTEGDEALAIVFPELLRWNAFNDYLETSAVEVGYINSGSGATNFSIGPFQMKPRFIEQLENYVATHDALKTFEYVVIKGKSDVESRRERVYRLKQFDWQLRYAHVFWLVAQHKFECTPFENKQARVRYYATAYNYGFLRPAKEIEVRLNRPIFPFGANYKGEQLPYGDFAIEFLNDYAQNFN